ncbi:MAG: response regulator transcription factor [Bacillota bacterium]
MYKLVIADDEPTELKFIRYVVDTYKLPFYICGEAENGEQAVEMVEKYRPEFVIIDIRMPLMDGLEATGLIKSRHPLAKVYILTAYEYFDYAKKAIQAGAEDYLLKPIKPEQLVETLKKGLRGVLRQRLDHYRRDKVKRQVNRIKPVVRSQLVSDMITGGDLHPEKLSSIKQFLGISVMEPTGVLAASVCSKEGSVITDSALCEAYAREIDGLLGYGMYKTLPGGEIVVFYRKVNFYSINELLESWGKKRGVTLYAGISAVLKENQILTAFREADTLRGTRLFWRLSGVITSQQEKKNVQLPNPAVTAKRIFSAVLQRRPEAAKEMVIKIFDDLQSNLFLPEQVIAFVNHLTSILVRDFCEMIAGEDYVSLSQKYEASPEKLETSAALQEFLLHMLDRFHDMVSSPGHSLAEQSVKWAAGYVSLNYHEEITMDKMAERLFLSPSYFSRIFKKHTGEGFAAYLSRTRMERAREFLSTGRYSVAEVAKKVGFGDPSYFSTVFKKHFNISPQQVASLTTEQES